MVPQNIFDHCAQTLSRRKLKYCDFNINIQSIKKVIFGSGVTKAMSLSGNTQDFLKLSFHMFP